MKAKEIEAIWRGRLLDVWNHEAGVDLVAMEIRASLAAHANECLERVVEFLLTHRVAWTNTAPHHRVILEAEPDAAMKAMAEAVRTLKE